MKIKSFNPIIWVMLFALSISRYCACLSPVLSDAFKLGYSIAVFVLMYGLVTFECWRLENAEVDYKVLAEKVKHGEVNT